MRLIFMGSPDFSVPILSTLIEAGHEIACVYAQPPRPAGRGHKERPCPVHAFAAEKGIEVRTPKNFKADPDRDAFAGLGADLAVVAAYGLILPQAVLDAPKHGCINVHASLLPRWRGAAPIHRALLAGDDFTGVTIMQMDAGLDTGDMLLREEIVIGPKATAQYLHDALSQMGARLMAEAIRRLEAGRLPATPQPEDGVTYAKKLEKDEGLLDWTRPAAELERQVRGLNPWPGVWFEHDGNRIKVLAAQLAEGAGPPGRILDDGLSVACGDGALRPTRVQRAGKAAADTGAFLRGYDLPAGTDLV